ncbi:MAG: polymer-forming cytoskeletal protein [Candidatus Aminicenantes bacterium]|nr:polymer-forming cytoskeletal protein [Candidatus Aminicenantes bacterium]
MLKYDARDKEKKDYRESPSGDINSRLGSSLRVKGEISGSEDLFIDGRVNGKIKLLDNNLTIRESGKVTADIHVKNIIVSGSVEGNIYASDKVCITERGRMKGDIISPRISIMEGSQFMGSIKMGKETEKPAPLKAKPEPPPQEKKDKTD